MSSMPPDQPDGIDEQSNDLPSPDRAAERVRLYVSEMGDGLYDAINGHGLYGRDLEALSQFVTDALKVAGV